jgi:hypothetical protein
VQLNYYAILQDYVDDSITTGQLVSRIREFYEYFRVYANGYSDTEIISRFESIDKNTIGKFLANVETLSTQEVLSTLKEVETKGLMGAGAKFFAQHRTGYRYEIIKSGDTVRYVKTTEELDEETKNEILATSTEVHIDTLISNFGVDDISQSLITRVRTDFGGDIVIDKENGHANIVVTSSNYAHYLLGFMLYEVLVRFDGINTFSFIPDAGGGVHYDGSAISRYADDPDSPIGWFFVEFLNAMKLAEAARGRSIIAGESTQHSTRDFNFAISTIGIRGGYPNRELLKDCGSVKIKRSNDDVYMAIVENYDVTNMPVIEAFSDDTVLIDEDYLDLVGIDPENITRILEHPNVSHINNLRFRSWYMGNVSRKGGNYSIYTGDQEEIEITGENCFIPVGVSIYDNTGTDVTVPEMYKFGARIFNRVGNQYVQDRDLSIPNTTFLTTYGVSPTNIFRYSNIAGYDNGAIGNVSNILYSSCRLSVNGVELFVYDNSSGYIFAQSDLHNTMLNNCIIGGEPVIVASPYSIRDNDLDKIRMFFVRIVEAAKFHMMPIDAMYSNMDDPITKSGYIARVKSILNSLLTYQNFIEFIENNNTITTASAHPEIKVYLSNVGVSSENIELPFLMKDGTIDASVMDDPFGVTIDGNVVRWYTEKTDDDRFINRSIDLRSGDTASNTSYTEFDVDAPTVEVPAPEPKETRVEYTFTENGDGSVTIDYVVYDEDDNDITDQISTLTIGEYFMHKEVN